MKGESHETSLFFHPSIIHHQPLTESVPTCKWSRTRPEAPGTSLPLLPYINTFCKKYRRRIENLHFVLFTKFNWKFCRFYDIKTYKPECPLFINLNFTVEICCPPLFFSFGHLFSPLHVVEILVYKSFKEGKKQISSDWGCKVLCPT